MDCHLFAGGFFNPVGADASGLLAENPRGKASNLFPAIREVIQGRSTGTKDFMGQIFPRQMDMPFGISFTSAIWPTLTWQRCKRLKRMEGFSVYNIGTGTGLSVLEIVNAFREFGRVAFARQSGRAPSRAILEHVLLHARKPLLGCGGKLPVACAEMVEDSLRSWS